MKATLNFFLAIMLTLLSSCANTSQSESKSSAESSNDKVVVLYFHGKNRCATCKAVGQFSKELVQQLNGKDVEWKEVDLSTSDGERIGDKYEINGSGLVVARGGNCVNLTKMAFRYALSDPSKFKAELKGEIQKLQN